MKKNISAAFLALACASVIGTTALADGPIGDTLNGIGRAGEDILRGAGEAIGDAANGVGNAVGDMTGTGRSTRTTSGSTASSSTRSSTTSNSSSNATSGSTTSSNVTSSNMTSSNLTSGVVAGISESNPAMGVTYGATAATAVVAAIAVVLSANRKNK